MMTLDMKAGFEALAFEDNLHRIQNLLTDLDLDQSYSSEPEFPASLKSTIQSLQKLGVLSVYQQACVLLACYEAKVEFEQFLDSRSSASLVVQCVQLALNRGVPRAAFQHLHHGLAGLGRIDQPWLELRAEPDLLQGWVAGTSGQFVIDVACNHQGVIDPSVTSEFNTQANTFRSETGFQHPVFGKFTPGKLLGQICQHVIPGNQWVVSPHPVVERCELGINHGGARHTVQQLHVVDARKAELQYRYGELEWTGEATQQAENAWQCVDHMNDAGVRIAKPFLHADFKLQAGWCKSTFNESPFEFVTTGNSTLRLPATALQWHAHFLHSGVLINLTIQAANDVCIDWNFYDTRPAGQLPFGEPLLVCQQSVPLNIQLSPVVCVGKPLLNLLAQTAGEMTFKLLVKVDPESRRLGAELVLSHSELVCQWQAIDPMCGIASKNWILLPASTLMRWEMIHG